MVDQAHKWTDAQIAALERRIRDVYRDASSDTQRKLDKFIAKFRRDDKIFRKQMEEGKITEADYRDWLAGQVFQGKRWRAQLRDLTETMTRSNQLAMQMVNDATPDAFAYNANWASFEIERAGNANMGFGLYDQQTVKRLLRDEPTLLPPSRVDIPKDKRWNMQAISTQITQGIIQGEALDTIAKRLQRVAAMNFNSARTHARTAMTGAQNAGRMESYHRAEAMGIKTRKRWLATLDNHTRHAHAALDGQVQDVDKPFDSELGKIMYPGDPDAAPANVYNCRCTLVAELVDYPAEHAQRWDNEERKKISDMTYAEWAGWKKEGE